MSDDIMTTAKDLAGDWAMPETEETCAFAIAAALLAERERCAKIATANEIPLDVRKYGATMIATHNSACRSIAAAIRKETE